MDNIICFPNSFSECELHILIGGQLVLLLGPLNNSSAPRFTAPCMYVRLAFHLVYM